MSDGVDGFKTSRDLDAKIHDCMETNPDIDKRSLESLVGIISPGVRGDTIAKHVDHAWSGRQAMREQWIIPDKWKGETTVKYGQDAQPEKRIIRLNGHTKEVPTKYIEDIKTRQLSTILSGEKEEETMDTGDISEPYEPEKEEYKLIQEEELHPKKEKKPAETQTSVLKKPVKTPAEYRKEANEIWKEQIALTKSRDPNYNFPTKGKPGYSEWYETNIQVVRDILITRYPGLKVIPIPGEFGEIIPPQP